MSAAIMPLTPSAINPCGNGSMQPAWLYPAALAPGGSGSR
jgi:hypothetical protein